jgi:hypothetical protein
VVCPQWPVVVVHEGVGVRKNHQVVVGDQMVPCREPPNTLACRPQTTVCSLGRASCGREGSGGDIFSLTRGAGETGRPCEVVGAEQGEPEEYFADPLVEQGREVQAEAEVLAILREDEGANFPGVGRVWGAGLPRGN